jgi:UDP-GlcNAc:undecaprenyl-phosphate GlcNAc-1-phosphate transferase
MNFILLLIITFFLSLLSIYLVKKFAYVNNFTISQQKDRWHKGVVALYGGFGFIPVFILASFFYIWLHLSGDYKLILSLDKNNEIVVLLGILLGTSLMFVVGIIDDINNLRVRNKIFFQAVAASIFLTFSDVVFIDGYPLLNTFITYFWFIGVINAVNLLDNMDGLASGVVIISLLAAIFFILESSTSVQSFSWKIILLLIASVIAFWFYNFPPASIFMGDCGSLPLGFLLACFCSPNSLNSYFLSVNSNNHSALIGLAISVAIIAVPIFDTAFVTITRKLEARKITQGGIDHVSHRLLVLGAGENKVLMFFYFLSIAGVVTAILIVKYPIYWPPLIIFLLLNMVILGIYLGSVKATKSDSDSVNFHIKGNQLAEVVLDIGIISVCFYASYMIRFGTNLSIELQDLLYISLPIVIGSSLTSFGFFGIYNKKWGYFSISDYLNFMKGVIGAMIISIAILTLFFRFPDGNSRSVFLIYSLLLFPVSFLARFSFNFLENILVKLLKINLDNNK